jgi:transposase
MTPYQLFVGGDIAATSATARWKTVDERPSRPITFAQHAQDYTIRLQHLLATNDAADAILIVLEAPGTYWIALATTLAQAGFAVSVIHPSQTHAFAKALLKRAKTDTIDAHTLAELGARLQPARWTPPPTSYQELQQRLAPRDTRVDLRTHVRNQHHALLQQPLVIASVRERMDRLIQTLNDQIAAVEAELATAVQPEDAWAAAAARLQTISGVGLLTACWLLVRTLHFTRCPTAEAATSDAELAPHPRHSGTRVRGRTAVGHTGNARLRRALYLATLSSAQHNPVIRAFYDRLCQAGKPPKVARCAAARKLLHIAWALVTKERDVDPTYSAATVARPGFDKQYGILCILG